MKLPLLTLASNQTAPANQPDHAEPSPTSAPGSVFMVNGMRGREPYLVIGQVFSEAESLEVLSSLPSSAYSLSARGYTGGEKIVGIYSAPQAAVDLVSMDSFNIRSQAHRQVLANTLWHCACAQVRQDGDKFFAAPTQEDAHAARMTFAVDLMQHNEKRIANFDQGWKKLTDPKTAGWFRPQDELLSMVQRVAADQLMVGGNVEFSDPALCKAIMASPDFLSDPELSKTGKLVVLAVNDPNQFGYQVTGSLAGWFKGQNGRTVAENPYTLAPEGAGQGEVLQP